METRRKGALHKLPTGPARPLLEEIQALLQRLPKGDQETARKSLLIAIAAGNDEDAEEVGW